MGKPLTIEQMKDAARPFVALWVSRDREDDNDRLQVLMQNKTAPLGHEKKKAVQRFRYACQRLAQAHPDKTSDALAKWRIRWEELETLTARLFTDGRDAEKWIRENDAAMQAAYKELGWESDGCR